jgi:hypothetical protein
MPRKILKRFSPDKHALLTNGAFRRFSNFALRAHVWHLNRRSANRAVLIGMFCAFIPLPIQMFLAIAACIFARAYLPLCIGIVWLTNPLTIPPVFYGTYRLGAFMLDMPVIPFHFEMSWQWLMEQFSLVWKPLFLGSFTTGIFFAALSYTLLDLFWRRHTLQRWRARLERPNKKEES